MQFTPTRVAAPSGPEKPRFEIGVKIPGERPASNGGITGFNDFNGLDAFTSQNAGVIPNGHRSTLRAPSGCRSTRRYDTAAMPSGL